MGENRGRNSVDRHHPRHALLDRAEQFFDPPDIGRFGQALMHGLGGDEVVGQVDLGRPVLKTRLAPGKNSRCDFLRAQALDPRRNLAPARRTHHRQRPRRDVTHSDLEHRRGQQRLLEHAAHRARGNHRHQRLEREAVARVEREQHRVVDRGSLDFEIE